MTESTFPIQLYTSPDGAINLDVHVDQETIWLTEEQMTKLFGKANTTINEHINNIYAEWELIRDESLMKQRLSGNSGLSTKPTNLYNLDVVISVGYRVKSLQWVIFRKRANNIIKQHILKWYTLNQARLTQIGITDVTQSLAVIKRALETSELSYDESRWLVELMTTYIPSLITLNQYDTNNLPTKGKTSEQKYRLDKNEADQVLMELKKNMISKGAATNLFALPRSDGLDGIFGMIYQGFWWQEVYETVEEKAAHLLYLVIKNHPFADGNKRSGAFLFVWYLSKNGILLNETGLPKISEQTLVALALLVATSQPQERDLMIKLIVTLLG